MATMQSRLADFITALGADIKAMQLKDTRLETARDFWLPTGIKQSNLPAALPGSVLTQVSGRLELARCPVKANEVYTNVSWFSVAASVTPTQQLFGIFDQNRVLLRSTVNGTTGAWAASTRKALALTSTWSQTTDGWVYVGIMQVATTPATILGTGTTIATTGMTPIAHGSSDTGLTTALPSTAAALTALTGVPLVMLD